jgi:hypothetical protein
LVLIAVAGCADITDIGFGPFPSSGLGGGQLTAGVAGFVPNVVPQEGEFSLLIVNTDSEASHTVMVTPLGGLAVNRDIGPCSAGTVAVSCEAESVLVELLGTTAAVPPSVTVTPVEGTCTQRIVYIGVPAQTGTDGTGGTDQTPTEPPTLTETLPESAADCGLAGLPSTLTGGLGQ